MLRDSRRSWVAVFPVASLLVLHAAGCANADHAKEALKGSHRQEVVALMDALAERHRDGVGAAAARLAPGFALPTDTRVDALRRAMRSIRDPTRRPDKVVGELTVSPLSFMAALDSDGTVLTRDVRDPANDRVRGQDWAARFEVVRDAIGRQATTHGAVGFVGDGGTQQTVWLFVAPAKHNGDFVGAIALGISMKNLVRFLGRQLRLDHGDEAGVDLWVYGYDGAALVHQDTPLLVDAVVPDSAARSQGLRQKPDGYLGEASVSGRPYGYYVFPVPALGPSVGFIVFRADAK